MAKRLYLTYFLNLLDLLFTFLLFLKFGASVEANPIGVALLQIPTLAVLYKVLGVGLCLWVLYKFRGHRIAQIGSYAVLAVYAGLAVYHAVIVISIGFLVWRSMKTK